MTLRWLRALGPRIVGGSSHVGDVDPLLAAWVGQPGLELADVDAAVVGAAPGVAVALADRGARVTALHASQAASVDARKRMPRRWRHRVRWRVADLAAPPADLVGAFGLVVASDVESQPPATRDAAMMALGALVGVDGWLVAVVLLATSQEGVQGAGPPWALAPADLTAWRAAGLERVELAHPQATTPPPPAQRVRTTWRRPPDDHQLTGPAPG